MFLSFFPGEQKEEEISSPVILCSHLTLAATQMQNIDDNKTKFENFYNSTK